MRTFRPRLPRNKEKGLTVGLAIARLKAEYRQAIEQEFNCSVSVQARERSPLGRSVRDAMCKALKIDYISGIPKANYPSGWKSAGAERGQH